MNIASLISGSLLASRNVIILSVDLAKLTGSRFLK